MFEKVLLHVVRALIPPLAIRKDALDGIRSGMNLRVARRVSRRGNRLIAAAKVTNLARVAALASC